MFVITFLFLNILQTSKSQDVTTYMYTVYDIYIQCLLIFKVVSVWHYFKYKLLIFPLFIFNNCITFQLLGSIRKAGGSTDRMDILSESNKKRCKAQVGF